MTSVDMRAQSHKILDQMDERFLEVVYAMLETYARQAETDPVVSFDAINNTPRTASELTKLLDDEIAAINRGEYLGIEEFSKDTSSWGRRTG